MPPPGPAPGPCWDFLWCLSCMFCCGWLCAEEAEMQRYHYSRQAEASRSGSAPPPGYNPNVGNPYPADAGVKPASAPPASTDAKE
jgi:hypothetical protein